MSRKYDAPKFVAEKIVEQFLNGEMPSLSVALAAIGESPKNVSIARSDTFQKTLFKLFPYQDLARVQVEQTKAFTLKSYKLDVDADVDEFCERTGYELVSEQLVLGGKKIYVKVPNWTHRANAIDKIYRLQGLYAPETYAVVRPLENMTDEELLNLVNNNGTAPLPVIEAEIIESPPS